MWSLANYLAKRWSFTILWILVIASFGRNVQVEYFSGDNFVQPNGSWSDTFWYALKAPLLLFEGHLQLTQSAISSHIGLTAGFVVYGFVMSYIIGIAKGVADVFWSRKTPYQFVQGIAWILDAIPLFGLIVILETGTLYLSMYIHHLPFSMLPDKRFWSGDFLRANVLMIAPMMYISRQVYITVSQQLGEEYLLTARGKGIPLRTVFTRHVFQNCIPKLLNEASTVMVMLMSSLLALEYLSFQDKGAMANLFANMGNAMLGQTSLYTGDTGFYIQTVSCYLLLIAVTMTIFHLLAFLLHKRWEVKHNYA